METSRYIALSAAALLLTGFALRPPASEAKARQITQGQLTAVDKDGNPRGDCPLKHTDVKAEISGFLARVTVTQEFHNPNPDKIEAVYTFPLPQHAAVDDMTMLVGHRTIKGTIKRKEEARKIYEEAKARGNVASLLDQERPNIFTQQVANIMPGEQVKIVISYVETLQYEAGTYEFVFPMVVGPRYIPGTPTGRSGGGWSPDTNRVPDASRITPPVAGPGTRAGHDISVEVALDAGVPVDKLECPTHLVDTERPGPSRAVVRLKDQASIPNKDFILRYDVAGRRISDAVLLHRGSRGGFFTLILQPPERVTAAEVTPKEIVFVIDTSGSMMGFPMEKAKEAMKLAIDGLNPQDTFNLITFSGDTHILFPEPVPATPQNVRAAQQFLAGRQGGGGTEMMKAIRAALDPSDSQQHVRVVCFMTDGYVGNDMEIIGEVKKHANARVFSFGIGSSVNRFLLDGMARAGRGEVEYVGLNDDGSAAAKRFHERVRNPLLTDISLDFGGLPVSDLKPGRIPDLFSAKPLIITGRFGGAARGVIKLRGKSGGRDFVRDIDVTLPASESRHDVLATLWARRAVEDLMAEDWNGMQSGNVSADLRERIVKLGLQFRLMTQFTSFVAVEEKIITEGGQPRRVEVPVEMPEGVSHEGVFGEREVAQKAAMYRGASGQMALSVQAPAIVGGLPAPMESRTRRMDVPARAKTEEDKGVARDERQLVDAVRGNEALSKDAVRQKLAPSLLNAISQGRTEKVQVQIQLTDASAQVLEQLKQLGLEILTPPGAGKIVTGRIEPSKLAKLAELTFVRYIAPL